jgi:GT2 family glycosyltransferase
MGIIAAIRSFSFRPRRPPLTKQRPLIEQLEVSDRPAVAKIVMLYKEILDRPADPDGLLCYLTELRKGTPLAALARVFLNSAEYAERPKSISLSDDGVDRLARSIADKIETTAESEWPSLLASLMERGRAYVDQPIAYRWWLDDFERPVLQDRVALEVRLHALRMKPTFTFVVDVTGSRPGDVWRTTAAVRGQIYPHLRLFLIVHRPWTWRLTAFFVLQDRRVRVVRSRGPRPMNRLSLLRGASSPHDFTAFIRCGDRISAIATLAFAEAVVRDPALVVIYADSDSTDERGRRHSPEFRSQWDPDRLLAGEGLGPLVMYSTTSLKRLPAEMEHQVSPESEFRLYAQIALSTEAGAIGHLPRVLCHRKCSCHNDQQRTEARAETLRPFAAQRGARFISASGGLNASHFRLIYPVPQPAPLVSIVIPTRDRVDLLRRCIGSIFDNTNYPSVEVVLVDNGSCEDATSEYYAKIGTDERIRFVQFPGEFNWGAMNNAGARAANGEVLVLLNNDIEVIESDWLNELVGQVLRPAIGAVGARLLYPNHALQHGGLVCTPKGAAQHVMRHSPPDDPGYMGLLGTVRQVSAVTGACLAIRKAVYEEVGGIEQHRLRVACSDVDLCLRVRARGYRVLWTPHATLLHEELATRGSDDTPEKRDRARKEEAYMATTWAGDLKADPFWSPNLAAEEDTPPLFEIPPP